MFRPKILKTPNFLGAIFPPSGVAYRDQCFGIARRNAPCQPKNYLPRNFRFFEYLGFRHLFVVFTFGLLAACTQGETGAQSAQQEPASQETAVQQETQITDVSAVKAAVLLKAQPEIVVLDVRTPAEFAAGHIAGALNIDFKSADFSAQIAKLDTTKTYLVHCRSGGRSARSLKAFKQNGFKTIIHMHGGIIDWNKSGLPTVQ